MIWFKHYTNASRLGALVSRVEAKFKLQGYARLFLLIEAIASQMNVREDPPIAEYPQVKWCSLLRCKPIGLRKFIEYLAEIGAISSSNLPDLLRIEFCNLAEMLDNRAASSRLRRPSGDPYIEENREDEEEIEVEEETVVDDAKTLFSWKPIHTALESQTVRSSLPRSVVEQMLEHGLTVSDEQLLFKKIATQFSKTDKARSLGKYLASDMKLVIEMARNFSESGYKHKVDLATLMSAVENRKVKKEDDPKWTRSRDLWLKKQEGPNDVMYFRLKAIATAGAVAKNIIKLEEQFLRSDAKGKNSPTTLANDAAQSADNSKLSKSESVGLLNNSSEFDDDDD